MDTARESNGTATPTTHASTTHTPNDEGKVSLSELEAHLWRGMQSIKPSHVPCDEIASWLKPMGKRLVTNAEMEELEAIRQRCTAYEAELSKLRKNKAELDRIKAVFRTPEMLSLLAPEDQAPQAQAVPVVQAPQARPLHRSLATAPQQPPHVMGVPPAHITSHHFK